MHENLAEHAGGGGALWPADAIGLPFDEAAHRAANDSGTTIYREGLLKINCNVPDFGLRLLDTQWEAPTALQLFCFGGRGQVCNAEAADVGCSDYVTR